MTSEWELGLARSLTSSDFADRTGYGIIFGSKKISGLVRSVANFIWTGSVKVLEVVSFVGDVVVDFDNLPACSMTSRSSEERICCKFEGCEEAGENILCFENLPTRAMTSRLSVGEFC